MIKSCSVVLRSTDGNDGDATVTTTTYRAWGKDDSVYITVDTLDENDYDEGIISDVNAVYTGVQNVDIKLDAVPDFGNVIFACYDSDGLCYYDKVNSASL